MTWLGPDRSTGQAPDDADEIPAWSVPVRGVVLRVRCFVLVVVVVIVRFGWCAMVASLSTWTSMLDSSPRLASNV